MREITGLFLFVLTSFSQAMAFQATKGPEAAKTTVGACTLLTRELVTQVTPYEKEALNLVLTVPPTEDSVGPSGSACNYGGVTMQVDPFTRAVFEKQRQPTWVVVPALGDIAYFRDNQGMWAELYVSAGPHVLTIQMDVPDGRTAASIQSNVVALAKALLPKL